MPEILSRDSSKIHDVSKNSILSRVQDRQDQLMHGHDANVQLISYTWRMISVSHALSNIIIIFFFIVHNIIWFAFCISFFQTLVSKFQSLFGHSCHISNQKLIRFLLVAGYLFHIILMKKKDIGWHYYFFIVIYKKFHTLTYNCRQQWTREQRKSALCRFNEKFWCRN